VPEPPRLACYWTVDSPLWLRARARLWPTRRYFELRQSALESELAGIARQVSEIAGQVSAIGLAVGRVEAENQRLLAVQAEMQSRARRSQALVARTYERLHDWPSLLAEARVTPQYASAYEETEPLVSIPIPTYHSPDTLCDRALASVQAQTYDNWEAIVVGDHCEDDTEARVRSLGDPRIRFHNLPVRENDPDDPWERWAVRGSIPRSTGIALATGEWIAPLSHDDAWDPDHLATLLHAARSRRAEVAYSPMRVVKAEHAQGLPADAPVERVLGAWPPKLGYFNWQSAIFNGALGFMRYDRSCALASEPNDWNLARRAWEAGVRFTYVDRDTSTLYVFPRQDEIAAELAARGIPPTAMASP
jgi:Glycosyl transferase family 2